MSYYLTNENSFLNINNAHLKVSGNVHADVMKIGAVEFAPIASNVTTTTNFTNVETGLTTSSNLHIGGTLTMGTVEVIATTHNLENTTTNGNITPHTVEFTNPTTSLVASGNVEVGGELIMTGTGALTVPVGTTEQQPTGVAGMIRFNSTLNRLEVYNGVAWLSIAGVSATGGTITNADGYTIHTFTSSGTFTMIAGGQVDYLIVSGGGGGSIGADNSIVPGGSGAGGMIEATNQTISPGTYNIVIGAGGQGGARGTYTQYTTRSGQNGSVSSAFGIAPLGGGVGAPSGDDVGTTNSAGRGANTSGGSGGGGTGWRESFSVGASGESGQGNQGGNGFDTNNSDRAGGGGGGAGQQGTNAAANSGGTGGNGIVSGISGTQVYYAGGGGGVGRSQANGGPVSGGLGGGGKGTYNITPDANGVDGLGGGAGAITSAGTSVVGGTGGDGIVIIRYLT